MTDLSKCKHHFLYWGPVGHEGVGAPLTVVEIKPHIVANYIIEFITTTMIIIIKYI